MRLRRVQPFADADANLILVESERCPDAAKERINPEKTAPADERVSEKTARAADNETTNRSAGKGMITEAPLIVYESPGVYTDEIRRIYGIL